MQKDKPGLAFLALGGILFLDEIGDIPMTLQPRIMKFIEETHSPRMDGKALSNILAPFSGCSNKQRP